MIIKSKDIYDKILSLRKIDKTDDINFIIDDDNLYVFAKGNPLRIRICRIPESLLKSDVVIMITEPPIDITDLKILLFDENIKLDIKGKVVFINDKPIKSMYFKIDRKPPIRFYFTFPYIRKNKTIFKCVDGNISVNGEVVFSNSKISDFTKEMESDYLTYFFDRKVYIFETKNRIYLKNMNGDYIHLDYK